MNTESQIGGTRDLLSAIVPCYNEEAVLSELHRRVSAVLVQLAAKGLDYELIFVDDGSRDGTGELLRGLQQSDPRVRVIRFSRNFGHQFAVTAGIDYAAGDAVVVLDADLQHPPEIIPQLVDEWRRGSDVVHAVRRDRVGEAAFKRGTSRLFYRVINRLSETNIPAETGDFRLMSRRVVEVLKKMPERDRFVRGMVGWVGFNQVSIRYESAVRYAGESKYTLRKMIAFGLDGMVSFSVSPLRIATTVGFVSAVFSLLGIVYALFVRLFSREWVPGWAGLFIVVLLIGGIQLLCLGIVGEYVGRIYGEAKRRPLYLVAESYGFNPDR